MIVGARVCFSSLWPPSKRKLTAKLTTTSAATSLKQRKKAHQLCTHEPNSSAAGLSARIETAAHRQKRTNQQAY